MPYGVEVILQVESTKGARIKVSIKKQFDTTREANEWFVVNKEKIRLPLAQVERLVVGQCK